MMSFTTNIYDEINKDLTSKPVSDSKSTAMRLVTYSNKMKVAFAIDKNTYLKSIFLSICACKDTVYFPKWKGVSIELVQLPDYGADDVYIVLKELPNSVDYIFDIVAEDLRKSVEKITKKEDSLETIKNVISKWKKFFQYDGDNVLSEIQQQGLFGELYFLSESIDKFGIHSIARGAGCEKETHDFYFGNNAVEVKATSTKEPYLVHISSEYQLDLSDVNGSLFLKFYALRKSKNSGVTLPMIIDSIRKQLDKSPTLLMQLNDKLHKYGYFDEVNDLYTIGYYVRDNLQYEIAKGFPAVTKSMLSLGVSKIEYSLGIDHCKDYAISDFDLYERLMGE